AYVARRLAGDPGDARRGERGDGRRDGCRRPPGLLVRRRDRDHRDRRARWWYAREAGGDGLPWSCLGRPDRGRALPAVGYPRLGEAPRLPGGAGVDPPGSPGVADPRAAALPAPAIADPGSF